MKKKILFSVLGVALFGVAVMLNVQSLKNNVAEARMEKTDKALLCCTSKPGLCEWTVNGEVDYSCDGSFH